MSDSAISPIKLGLPAAPTRSRKAAEALRRLSLTPAQLRREQARQRLARFILIAIACGLVASALLYRPLVIDTQKTELALQTQTRLDSQQAALNRYMTKQADALAPLALSGDARAALAAKASHQAELIDALRPQTTPLLHLHVFNKDAATLNREAEFPIRYAELDLINRTQAGDAVRPEFNKINERWIINWSYPIAEDGAIIGSLLAVQDAAPLLNLLRAGDAQLGIWELDHAYNDQQSMQILRVGDENIAAGPRATGRISGTYLSLSFTPSRQLAAIAKPLPLFWLGLSAAILAALVALAIALSRALSAQIEQRSALRSVAKPYADDDISDMPLRDLSIYQRPRLPSRPRAPIPEEPAEGENFTPTRATEDFVDLVIPKEIFRAYDIRGLVDDQLTTQVMRLIGRGLGTVALDAGETHLLVARDGRLHSPKLAKALIQGVIESGCHVIDMGLAPTPMLYFSTFYHPQTNSGLMLTASHNPKEYNGVKAVINNKALSDAGIDALYERVKKRDFRRGMGELTRTDLMAEYINRIATDVTLTAPLKVVIDCANAVPGLIAPELFNQLGCEVIEMFCDVDGNFPNHDPDPSIESNLLPLVQRVRETGADIGIAFDGDGDRVMLVSPSGQIIWPDRLLMIFAYDLLQRKPGADILFDVKCSRQLHQVIQAYGGTPVMWKTGHSPMKAKMEETRALLGGEYSGHIFMRERWYGFDDGLYAAARFLEIMTRRNQNVDSLFEGFPEMRTTPELKVRVPDQDKFFLIDKLIAQGDFSGGTISTIDGLKVDFPRGWGLVRASNTSPSLTLRFEAETEEFLDELKQRFKRELLKADRSLSLPF